MRNFGRNVVFQPRRRVAPRSVDELARIVRESAKLRAVGAAHSWSPAIVTDDTLVSLDGMSEVIALDRAAMQVTVQAPVHAAAARAQRVPRSRGSRAREPRLDRQPIGRRRDRDRHARQRRRVSLPERAGREDSSSLDGTGTAITIARGDPDFAGAVVALGALGIVHAVTFDVVDAFRLHDITRLEPFDDVIERIHEHVAASDHFKVWWFVPHDEVLVYRYTRTSAPANDSALRRWFKERVVSVGVYRSLLAIGKLNRRRWIPGINRFLMRARAGRPLDRISPSHIGFLTPIPPVHAETEWAFDARDAQPLLREYRKLLPDGGHSYNFIQELRFSKADELWLSPAYQRDSLWLSVYNIDRANWPAQLAKFEAFARAHGGRPHWGKEAAFDRAYLSTQYARLDEFAALARRHDPQGKFRNAWLDGLLG